MLDGCDLVGITAEVGFKEEFIGGYDGRFTNFDGEFFSMKERQIEENIEMHEGEADW